MSQLPLSESMFDSVQEALLTNWKLHLLPELLAQKPTDHLQKLVFLWWHLYQESFCARRQINRTKWHWNTPDEIYALDNDELLECLQMIHTNINSQAIASFRSVQESE